MIEDFFLGAVRQVVREEMRLSNRGLLSVAEAAAYLKISKSLLFELHGAGELKAVRRGKLVRFDPADLDDWARRHKT